MKDLGIYPKSNGGFVLCVIHSLNYPFDTHFCKIYKVPGSVLFLRHYKDEQDRIPLSISLSICQLWGVDRVRDNYNAFYCDETDFVSSTTKTQNGL